MASKQSPHRLTFSSSLRSLTRPLPPPPSTLSLAYGYQMQGHTLILGYTPLSSQNLLTDPPTDWTSHTTPVLSYLPLGVCIVGIRLSPALHSISDKIVQTFQSRPILVFPNNKLILSNVSDSNETTHQLLELSSGVLSPITTVSYESISSVQMLITDYVIKFELKQEIQCDVTPASFSETFITALEKIRTCILSQKVVFSVLTGKSKSLSLPHTPVDSASKKPPVVKQVIPVRPLPYSLSLTLPPTSSTYTLSLHYNIWLPADLPNSQLDPVLREGVARYIGGLGEAATTPCFLSVCQVPHPLLPFIPLCLPNPHTHLLTNSLIDPLSRSALRHKLTSLLAPPPDTPYFFPHRVYPLSDLHLCAPHLSVSTAPPPSYTLLQTVSGLYDYYHYLTDGFDDCGWGCAYRSLQTIFSWYVLQGYVKGRDTPPSHLEIQEILVHLGDKPSTFAHSREWIGSVEIGLVLEDMLSVKYKIIPLNSADELLDTARQLLYHFEKFGTPVMIGGGQLAHTILGVAYDESMGTCQFLILDPHYKGPDELKAVLKGGGCAWRGIKFWKSNTFYNLCLPLRDFIE